MLIVEDLHWLDDESQALLDLLVDSMAARSCSSWSISGRNTAFGGVARPTRSYCAWTRSAMTTPMKCCRPCLVESEELLPLKQLIIETTGGTPFFMEETVQALFDEGALVAIGSASSWSSRLHLCEFHQPCKRFWPPASIGCATTRRRFCKLSPCSDANSC